jgi:fumarate hydratase class I
LLPLGPDDTTYRLVSSEGVGSFTAGGHRFLTVEPETLTRLTALAMHEIAHYLRPGHLGQLRTILEDADASANDRLPRHGASCPVALAVSCSADRQALAKITHDGVYLEQLEHDPARFLPDVDDAAVGTDVVHLDLSRPMDEMRAELSRYPVKTRLSLSGPMVVARDIAHAKIKERLDAGAGMPQYLRDHCVYYAGPAKTPEGMASGSFGPTTAGRMDAYVDEFQAAGGSLVMLAKGNRSRRVTDACRNHGGFYLGSIGGPAARLAQDCIRKVEVIEYPELGMEAVWRIEVQDFPAFVVVDDKGNDFFAEVSRPVDIRT